MNDLERQLLEYDGPLCNMYVPNDSAVEVVAHKNYFVFFTFKGNKYKQIMYVWMINYLGMRKLTQSVMS